MKQAQAQWTDAVKDVQKKIRYCSDIGMYAFDRSPRQSCKHATGFCREHCYNVKLYPIFKNMVTRDDVNELVWKELDGAKMNKMLKARRAHQTDRFRFCTRGEAFSVVADVYKVKEILQACPDTLFWIPTRAWRDVSLRDLIELEIMPLENARVMASIDPSNDNAEKAMIIERGWSTMFFGNDLETAGRFLCPKTHVHKDGACSTCKGGCFDAMYGYKQVHVHLNLH